MLSFQSIEKQFDDGTRALNRVSLEIPRGQFCVVLGPSGAGKSTLLRTVNGLTLASAGTVAVDGVAVEPQTLRAIRPRIGMIHQQFNLVERATALANVLAGALPAVPLWRALLDLYPRDLRRKAARLLHEVGLDEAHLSRRVTELSGGQQQRVGIARAFMLNPTMVLADEPVASLDPKTSRDILDLLKHESQAHGATVLCTLHQVDLAREFADRIIALRCGEVLFDGPPGDIDAATLHRVFGAHRARQSPSAANKAMPQPIVAETSPA